MPAGDGEQVDGDLFALSSSDAVVVESGDGDGADPPGGSFTGGAGDGGAEDETGARGCGDGFGDRRGGRTGVDDRGDGDACRMEVGDEVVGGVVRRRHGHVLPGGHTIAAEVGAHGRGEHDAGAVVVGEDDRAVVGAGGEHDLTGTDMPDLLAHSAAIGLGDGVGAVFEGDEVVRVVAAEDGRVLHVRELFVLGEPGDGGLDPRQGVDVVDRFGRGRSRGEQRAAGNRLVVEEQGASPGLAGFPGGGESGGAGADDEDVGVHVLVFVGQFVLAGVEDAESGEVVGLESFGDGDTGGGQHRFGDVSGVPGMHADERIGLLDAGAEDAACTSQVGRVAAVDAARGDERTGDRVTGEARVGLSVDGEIDRAGGVDAGGRGQSRRGVQTGGVRHRTSPWVSGRGEPIG